MHACREIRPVIYFLLAGADAHIRLKSAQKEDFMRFWGKVIKDNRLLRDVTAEENGGETRTIKVFHALEEICRELDLPKPLWLDTNIREFQKVAKARFRQDSFIEEIPFDYLEFQVIEEDPWI